MAKGNNYSAPVAAADLTAAATALGALKTKLGFIPKFGPDVITTATISPERLPMADLAVKVATTGADAMRKSCDPTALAEKIAIYRALRTLVPDIDFIHELVHNGLNVVGSDIVFVANNIHEDLEKDNGETVDLGDTRREFHEYFRRNKGGDAGTAPKS